MRPATHGLLACMIFGALSASAQSRVLPWTFTAVTSIGTGDADVYFTALLPVQIAVTPEDQLLIADREETRLLVLSRGGRLVRTLGRRGSGPGELSYPSSVASAPDSTVWAVNSGRRVVGFLGAGGMVPQELELPGAGSIEQLGFVGKRVPVLLRSQSDTLSLWRGGPGDPALLASVVRPAYERVAVAACGTTMPHRPIFASTLVWAARSDLVVSSTGSAWSVTVHRSSSPASILKRDAPPRQATRALALSEVVDGTKIVSLRDRKACVVPGAEILAGAGFAGQLPAYRALLFQTDDLVWAVHHTVPSEDGLADVYSLKSGWFGTVRLGSLVPVGFLSGGELVSLERDASDVPVIRIYRIVR